MTPITIDDLRALGWTVAVHNDYRMLQHVLDTLKEMQGLKPRKPECFCGAPSCDICHGP